MLQETIEHKKVGCHIIVKEELYHLREEGILLIKDAILQSPLISDRGGVDGFDIAETRCSKSHPGVDDIGEGAHYHIEVLAAVRKQTV